MNTSASVVVSSMIEPLNVQRDKCLKRLKVLTDKRDRYQAELVALEQREKWLRGEEDFLNRRIAQELAEQAQLELRLAEVKPAEAINEPVATPSAKPIQRQPRQNGKKARKALLASRAA